MMETERDAVFQKLNRVFREVFNRPSLTVTETTAAADVDGWDSLMHITLIAELEDCFRMKFRMKDVRGMQTVGEMADAILRETT